MKLIQQKRRAITSLVLVLIMCSLAACDSTPKKEQGTEKNVTTEADVSMETTSEEATKKGKSEEKNTEEESSKKHKKHKKSSISSNSGTSNSGSSKSAKKSGNTSEDDYIGMDKAKSIALNKSGINRKGIVFTSAYFSKGKYYISYEGSGMEYSYIIDGKSGKVLGHYSYDDESYDDDDWDEYDDDDDWDDWGEYDDDDDC